MNKLILKVFVYVVVVCPVLWCGQIRGHGRRVTRVQEHHLHQEVLPCDRCPRHGKCVPRVQCPAHLRPGSYNPTCHLDHLIGVCCFTGYEHAVTTGRVMKCRFIWFNRKKNCEKGVPDVHYVEFIPCGDGVRIQFTNHSIPVEISADSIIIREGNLEIKAYASPSDHRGLFTEHERQSRVPNSISTDEIKASHHRSRNKVAELMQNVDKLLVKSVHTLVNITSPSFGHHLSMATYDQRADTIGYGGLLNIFASEDLKSRQVLSEDELVLGLTENTDGPFCTLPPNCQSDSRYRSFEGECNNVACPVWGAAHTGFEKLLPPDYSDVVWSMRVAKSGLPLPSPRVVSNALLLDGSHPSMTHNLMFMQFGQFIAHDVSASVVFTAGNGSAISCCTASGTTLNPELQHFACAPIIAAADDAFYSHFGQTCMNFVRAMLAPSSDCSVGYAKQMNGATHFLDLSHLYGISKEKCSSLRTADGLLKTFKDYGRELPPLAEKKDCMTVKDGAACFDSGDNHGNQIISLTVIHAVFTREHNRIAKALAALNPGWDDDTVFFESRRILQAEFQHIIYNEWLPLLLGPELIKIFDLAPSAQYSTSYDPLVNPSLTSEFSTAAMRFGHSMVDGRVIVPSSEGIYETISIPEVMFQPSRMRLRHFLDRMLMGLALQPMQTVDPFVTEGLSRYMFHGGNPYGLDLAAINIQRGRDHGIRSYNEYRRLVGLQPFLEFSEFPQSAAHRLSSVYERPEDIDLWIGGLLEEPVQGAIIGPLFANIIADQFSRLKRGDRYFYEYGPDINPGAFSPSQLEEIKKVSISRLVCDNSDGIELFAQPPEGFLRADLHGNEPVDCNSPIVPAMDLNKFKI